MFAKNIYEVDRELGGSELLPSACPWMGNRPPKKKKIAIPGGVPRGAWLRAKLNHA